MDNLQLIDLLSVEECNYCHHRRLCIELVDDGGTKSHCACVNCITIAFSRALVNTEEGTCEGCQVKPSMPDGNGLCFDCFNIGETQESVRDVIRQDSTATCTRCGSDFRVSESGWLSACMECGDKDEENERKNLSLNFPVSDNEFPSLDPEAPEVIVFDSISEIGRELERTGAVTIEDVARQIIEAVDVTQVSRRSAAEYSKKVMEVTAILQSVGIKENVVWTNSTVEEGLKETAKKSQRFLERFAIQENDK